MKQETLNYKLTKDSQEDFYNIDTVNLNLDKIDVQMKKNEDGCKENSDEIVMLKGEGYAGETIRNNAVAIENNRKAIDKKVNIVVSEDIPNIDQRERKTFYFKITDTQSIPTGNDVRVSPNMGIKLL